MPIYEYRCEQCGEKFDKLVRSSADETNLCCPNCGSKQAEKLLSIFGTSGFSTTPNFTSAGPASCGPTGQTSG